MRPKTINFKLKIGFFKEKDFDKFSYKERKIVIIKLIKTRTKSKQIGE